MSKNPSTSWPLAQWLDYIEQASPQNRIELGLERITAVAKKLNVHTFDSKVITVAGTNGKGSTVNALETLYAEAGYTVGSYTSPHLIHFNERIKVNLKPISDDDLCDAFLLIESQRNEIYLTYFERATLAALVYFKKTNVKVIILEVGLGGRLDATNFIDADVAIITTIDFDHQEHLGDTLEAIGREKAGILRVEKPCIYADNDPPHSIVQVANDLRSPLYLYDRDFTINDHGETWDFIGEWRLNNLTKPKIQLKSASAAIEAVALLQSDLPVARDEIDKAMSCIYVPGRLQRHQFKEKQIDVLYDVSHNPQSARLLAKTIKTQDSGKRIHAVFSALKDKDILGLINPLKDCVHHWYFAQLENPRSAPAEYLLNMAKKAEILVEICYNSPLIAFEDALAHTGPGDLIVVFGSFYTVSQVLCAQNGTLERKGD